MKLIIHSFRKSLNKAYLKLKPSQDQMETFKAQLNHFFKQVNESETVEFHKNILSRFLSQTCNNPYHYLDLSDIIF